MIGLDTNVLVRYIMQDDPEQARAATRLVEARCTAEEPGLVSLIVLCELAWVLGRGYRASRQQLATVLRTILSAEELHVVGTDIAWRALRFFEAGSADLADYLIGGSYREHGASLTFTFNRAAAECELFAAVPCEPEQDADP